MDAIGHFEINYTAPMDKPPGTYTWWAVDVAKGTSNVVSYTITSLTGGYLVISAISSPQQVNAPFPVTVTAKDASGNTNTGFNGTAYLTSSLGNMNPSSVYLTNGTTTANITLYYGGNGYISANGKGLYGISKTFDVMGTTASSGKLMGYVRDYDDNPIPNATVYLDSLTKTTNAKGYFEFTNLPCKTYSVYANAPDGTQSQKKTIEISASNPISIYLRVATCNPGKTPILLVPGIMGSSTGSNNSFPTLPKGAPPAWDSTVWETDSHGLYDLYEVPGWRKLIDAFKPLGYTIGCNLFAVPYDWRMPIEQAAEKYLKQAIKDIKNKTGYDKVHVIAHSMGGLLTRYYIQNIDGDSIDRFAMVGTPNHGSATPYYLWFGGDPKKADDITSVWNPKSAFINLYSHTTQLNYSIMNDGKRLFPYTRLSSDSTDWGDSGAQKKAKEFYQEHIKTMGQLLSTDLFLEKDQAHFGLTLCNKDINFLVDLNENIDFKNVSKKQLFAGIDNSTIELIHVGEKNDMYGCGKPKWGSPDMPDEGDGTVLLSSAQVPDVTTLTKDSSHAELIYKYQREIILFITDETVQAQFMATDAATAAPALNLTVDGPVSPYLVSPSGKKLGFDPSTGSMVNDFATGDMKMDSETGFMSIASPEPGTYTLNLTSSYQRNFRGTIGYSDETRSEQMPFAGFIGSGAFTIRFTVSSAAAPVISIDPQLLPPEGLQADPVQSSGLKTYLSWYPETQHAITGYKIYSRLDDEPYLSLLWTGTPISLTTSHAWAESSAITPHLYAVSAVLSDGTETLISVLVTNNDRDHDGLTDADETTFGSDMNNPDTDGDGLLDSDEYIHGTNPTKKDTDGDGYSDYDEVQRGSDPLDPNSVPSTGLSTVISNSIGSRNTIKISDMSGTLPVSGDAITVSAWDANGNALPESAGATPLKLYNHGTNNISGSVLAARFPSGTPTLYKFAINSSKVVITNVKNSTNDAFKVPIVYLNGVTNFVSNSIGNYNTIKVSDMSGTLPASGSPISVKAWDANGSALTESGSAAPLVLYSHGTTSISGSTLTARFPTGSPMIYEFTVQSVKVLITNVKSSTDGKLNVPVAYTSGVSNFVSNSIGSYNTLEISDLSGALPSGVCAIIVKAWDANGSALSESRSAAPLTLHNHATTSISGSTLAARFPAGKPMTYEFSIESAKVLITNVKSSTDGLVEIPSIFTSGISNYATNFVSPLNTIKISDMSGAIPAGGVAISITAWDTNGNMVLESGAAVPLKLQNLGTTSISGSDLAARFPSGSPRMYEFSIGSSNAIVTSLTTSVDGTIKTPTVFTIGGYGGI